MDFLNIINIHELSKLEQIDFRNQCVMILPLLSYVLIH